MNDYVAPGSIASTPPGMPYSPAERAQDRVARGASLVALSLAVLLVTCIKALACWYPVAFGDESTYSLLARYGATEEVVQRIGLIDQLPNHLYYAIYRLAFSFGDNFYTGAKLLNSAFIAASFFPIYLLCRLFLPVGKAVALAAITVLGPISSYATYFMAESPYFFGFWTYVYLSIRSLDKPVIAQACISGVVLGCLFSSSLTRSCCCRAAPCFLRWSYGGS
jgi:phosphoglycerol transferase